MSFIFRLFFLVLPCKGERSIWIFYNPWRDWISSLSVTNPLYLLPTIKFYLREEINTFPHDFWVIFQQDEIHDCFHFIKVEAHINKLLSAEIFSFPQKKLANQLFLNYLILVFHSAIKCGVLIIILMLQNLYLQNFRQRRNTDCRQLKKFIL